MAIVRAYRLRCAPSASGDLSNIVAVSFGSSIARVCSKRHASAIGECLYRRVDIACPRLRASTAAVSNNLTFGSLIFEPVVASIQEVKVDNSAVGAEQGTSQASS